jgi:hypothetical protein
MANVPVDIALTECVAPRDVMASARAAAERLLGRLMERVHLLSPALTLKVNVLRDHVTGQVAAATSRMETHMLIAEMVS